MTVVGHAIDSDRLAERRWVATKVAHEEIVGDDRDPRRTDAFIVGRERSSELGPVAEQREETGADVRGDMPVVAAGDRDAVAADERHSFDDSAGLGALCLPVAERWIRRHAQRAFLAAFVDRLKASRLGVWKSANEDCVHHAEHGGRAADRQSERDDRDERERRRAS